MTTEERESRLDALEQAVKNYAETTRKALKARVEASRRILLGRSGAERLRASAVDGYTKLVLRDIDELVSR